jgi:hypothetical protein
VWDLKHAAGDISGLAGITSALHGLILYGQPPQPAPPPMVARTTVRTETNDLATAGF